MNTNMRLNGSVATIAAIVFVGDCSRGVLFPVLWSLCEVLGGTIKDLGQLVAAFSVGRLIMTIPLGWLCDRYRHRLSLLCTSSILFCGALLWTFTYRLNSMYALYGAQLMLGVGSGSLGVTRSYLVEQCTTSKRTEVMSAMTALQYAGFTVSPVIGSILSTIGKVYGGEYWRFAFPAIFIAFGALCSFIMLLFAFHDHEALQQNPSEENHIQFPHRPKDCRADVCRHNHHDEVWLWRSLVFLFICLNISTKGSIAVYETLAARTAAINYEMSPILTGITVTASGAIGSLLLLCMGRYSSTRDLHWMLFGIGVMAIAQILVFECDNELPTMGQFIASIMLMYALGYPIGHTALLGAFSKLKRSGPQAALMGYFASSGSLARILFPILASYLEATYRNSSFLLLLVLLLLSITMVLLFQDSIQQCILTPHQLRIWIMRKWRFHRASYRPLRDDSKAIRWLTLPRDQHSSNLLAAPSSNDLPVIFSSQYRGEFDAMQQQYKQKETQTPLTAESVDTEDENQTLHMHQSENNVIPQQRSNSYNEKNRFSAKVTSILLAILSLLTIFIFINCQCNAHEESWGFKISNPFTLLFQ